MIGVSAIDSEPRMRPGRGRSLAGVLASLALIVGVFLATPATAQKAGKTPLEAKRIVEYCEAEPPSDPNRPRAHFLNCVDILLGWHGHDIMKGLDDWLQRTGTCPDDKLRALEEVLYVVQETKVEEFDSTTFLIPSESVDALASLKSERENFDFLEANLELMRRVNRYRNDTLLQARAKLAKIRHRMELCKLDTFAGCGSALKDAGVLMRRYMGAGAGGARGDGVGDEQEATVELTGRIIALMEDIAKAGRALERTWNAYCEAVPSAFVGGRTEGYFRNQLADAERDIERRRYWSRRVCEAENAAEIREAFTELGRVEINLEDDIADLRARAGTLRAILDARSRAVGMRPDMSELARRHSELDTEFQQLNQRFIAAQGGRRAVEIGTLRRVEQEVRQLCPSGPTGPLLNNLKRFRAEIERATTAGGDVLTRRLAEAAKRIDALEDSNDALDEFALSGGSAENLAKACRVHAGPTMRRAPADELFDPSELAGVESLIGDFLSAAARIRVQTVRARQCVDDAGQEPELREAEAALEGCEFGKSAGLIKALPLGPERDALEQRWTEAYERESHVKNLVLHAKAIEEGDQDYKAAIETLEEAKSLSACGAAIAAIDKAIAGLRGKLAEAGPADPPEPPTADPPRQTVLVEGPRWQCFAWYVDKVFYGVENADLAKKFADTKFAQTHPFLQVMLYNFVIVGHTGYVEGNPAREAYYQRIGEDEIAYFDTELWPRYPWPALQEGTASPFNPDTTLDETKAFMALMLAGMMMSHQEGEVEKLEKDLKEFEDVWSGPPLARRPGFDVPNMFEMWRCDREMPQ